MNDHSVGIGCEVKYFFTECLYDAFEKKYYYVYLGEGFNIHPIKTQIYFSTF